MGADFGPNMQGYTGQDTFMMWVQKVLPTVYDDSLSYSELLGKVVDYLNSVIDNVNIMEENFTNLLGSYEQLENYVNESIDNVDDRLIPPGGRTNQALVKNSDENYDTKWVTIEGGGSLPPGGSRNQVLTKLSSTDGDATWKNLPTYDGTYEVTPLVNNTTTMLTASKYLDRNIVVKEIPYAEAGNISGGITVTIGG